MAKVKASSSATALNKVVLVERIGRSILFGYFLFMPLLFTQATVEGFEFPKFLALLLTAFLLLTVAIVALPGSRLQVAKRELRQPLSLAGLAFVASALVSTFASSAPSVSFFGHYLDFAGSLTFASYLILFLAVRQLIRTPEQRLTLLVAPTLSVGAVLFYGWLQASTSISTVGVRPRPLGSGNAHLQPWDIRTCLRHSWFWQRRSPGGAVRAARLRRNRFVPFSPWRLSA